MPVVLLALALLQAPTACVDPAAPLAHLVAVQPLPPTVDRRANEYVAVALRTGTRPQVWRAIKRLEDVQKRRHDDLAVHLAYGLMQSISTDVMPENTEGYRHRRVYDNSNAEKYVVRHLARAAELDPGQWLAGVTLARLAVGIRDDDLFAKASEVIRTQLAHDPSNAALAVALADVLIAQDRVDEAIELLGRVARSCAAAEAVLAEARILRGDSLAAAAQYVGALSKAMPDQLYRFYDDARVLMTPAQRREYAQLDSIGQRTWLIGFWNRSAAAAGRDLTERIVEHVRRLDHAHAQFRLTRSTGRGDRPENHMRIEQTFHDDDVPWDARGATWVRHGPPDRIVETKVGAMLLFPLNATWVYFGEDPPRMVHFAQPRIDGDPLGWYVVGTTFGAPCGAGAGTPFIANQRWQPSAPRSTLTVLGTDGARDNGMIAGYYFDRAAYDPAYVTLALACQGGLHADMMRQLVTNLDRDYRTNVVSLLTTETAHRRFPNALRMSVAGYEFRGRGGETEVAAVAWLNLGDAAGATPLQRVRLQLTVVDSGAAPLRFDTVLAVPAAAAGSGGTLRIARTWNGVTMRAPRLRAFVEDQGDPRRGGDVAVRLALGDTAGRHLSDIVIAEADRPGPLLRGATRLAPVEAHTIVSGDLYRVFFEVYGAREGETLQTTIRVRRTDQEGVRELLRIFKGRTAQRELRLDEPATLDARGAAVRDVNVVGDLVPGDYHVEVMVRGSFGVASRTARLRVVGAS